VVFFFFFFAKVVVHVCVCVVKINIGKYVMQVSDEGGEGKGVVKEAIPTNQAQKHVIKAS
jgi:hypothetical protein